METPDQRLRNHYLESRVNNATPGERLVMLYDALIENAELADLALAAPPDLADLRPAAHAVRRCIDILSELSSSLHHPAAPELCAQLGELYRFFTRELYDALHQRQPDKVRAILPLLRGLRRTWAEADRRAGKLDLQAAAIAA